MSNPSLFLIDGGLTQQPLSRAQVTALMADDLIRLDAWRSEADAIRALMALKLYSTFEIMTCVDDARQAAAQERKEESASSLDRVDQHDLAVPAQPDRHPCRARDQLEEAPLDLAGIWREVRVAAYSPVLSKPNKYQTMIQFIEAWAISKLIAASSSVAYHAEASSAFPPHQAPPPRPERKPEGDGDEGASERGIK